MADVTITRLASDRFRVVTGAGTVDGDLGWLRMQVGSGDPPVELREASEEHAVVGLWGPAARDILQATTADDVSNEALPYLTARPIEVAGAPLLAQRVSYVGELGWELWVDPAWAVSVWDRLLEAGRPHGLDVCGYRSLDGLRLEKGYRYFGTDLTASDTPDASGLAFCIDLRKDFLGREAVESGRAAGPPASRLRTLLVGDGDYITAFGGEAVHAGGEVVSRLRSCAYGYSVGRMVATASLPFSFAAGAPVEVEVFGDRVDAEVAEDVLIDPEGKRVRS